MGLFTDHAGPPMPAGRPNLWQAPSAAAPGSASGTMGAGVPPAGPLHSSGVHPDTLRHVAAHLHGIAQAMEGKPSVLPMSPVGTPLHKGTLRMIGSAAHNMAGPSTGPTINQLG